MSLFVNLPQELRSVLYIRNRCLYWPSSGEVWFKHQNFGENPTPRQKQWNTRFAGKKTGYLNTNGYIRVSLGPNSQEYYVHQIAFAIIEGYIPEEVDHIDKDKSNNEWINLRDADHSKNMKNVLMRSINSSGLKGVSWSKWNNKWRMDIRSNGVRYYSYHNTPEDAYLAYCDKSIELHGEFGSAV